MLHNIQYQFVIERYVVRNDFYENWFSGGNSFRVCKENGKHSSL